MVRSLVTLAALLGVGVSAGCKCPGFFNKNCSMRLVMKFDDIDRVNDGYAFIASAVVLPTDKLATFSGYTPATWFGGGEGNQHTNVTRFDFQVQSGQIDVATDRGKDLSYEIKEDNTIIVTFRNLLNPEEYGKGNVVVYAGYSESRGNKPLVINYGDIQRTGWTPTIVFRENAVVVEN